MEINFFKNQSEFRKWLKANHNNAEELWVGYHKKSTGFPSMTWSESVDQALCFGWIDGIRKSIDDKSYKIRFTPRKPTSIWSAVNIKKVEELTKAGKMQPAGIKAFDRRSDKNSIRYSFEQRNINLSKEYLSKLKTNKKACEFFESLAPSYKKLSVWWVMSAKKEETRQKRLDILINSSAEGKKIPVLERATYNVQRTT